MPDTPAEDLNRYRAYLTVLARQQVPRADRAWLDPSGIVQLTLLEVNQDATRLGELSLGPRLAWLRKALSRNLADEYRRQFAEKRDVRRERRIIEDVESSSAGMGQWLAAQQSSPSEQADRSERLLQLAAALSELPDSQRDAVEMHYFQHRPVSAIADEMGKTPAAVAGLLKRGLQTLRTILRDPNESSP